MMHLRLTISSVLLLLSHFCTGQQSLKQLLASIPALDYYDAGKKTGIPISDKPEILKHLNISTQADKEYLITGKYIINGLTMIVVSEYTRTEDIQTAILLDSSLEVLDQLDELAYDNAEGYYHARSYMRYNILNRHVENIYQNPKYQNWKYTLTRRGFIKIKDQVEVTAPSGLNVRLKPTVSSEVYAVAPQHKRFSFLGNAYEADNYSEIWVQVGAVDSLKSYGYVHADFVNRYIELQTDEYRITIRQIPKEQYEQKQKHAQPKPKPTKIAGADSIKAALGDKLIIEKMEDEFVVIKSITSDNGKSVETDLSECGLSAYYPDYHYLLLECGHASDFIIDMTTGYDSIEVIGNPSYYLTSPEGTFRLNGYYTGQANEHFLEKINPQHEPEYLAELASLLSLDYLSSYFWSDDRTLWMSSDNRFYTLDIKKIPLN